MIIEQVKVEQFKELNSRSEIYLWHFVQPFHYEYTYALESYFRKNVEFNTLPHLLETLEVDYYESFVEEGIDFLMRIGLPSDILYKNSFFAPVILLFKNGIFRASTNFTQMKNSDKAYCHCAEGVTQMLIDYTPEIIDRAIEKNKL